MQTPFCKSKVSDNLIYQDDFQSQLDGTAPQGWAVERHADLFHDLAEIRGGALRFLFAGNLHFPPAPPARTAQVTFTARSDVYSARCALRIYFRYDPRRRAGYCIQHAWGGDQGLETVFGIYRDGNIDTLARAPRLSGAPATPPTSDCRLRLKIGACSFAFYHQDICAARFADPARTCDGPGLIGLDRAYAAQFYVLDIRQVRIQSRERETWRRLWPERCFELPADWNGMTDPWRFRIAGWRSPRRTKLAAALEGGPAQRPPSVCDFRGLRGNSRLTRPYVRVESGEDAPQKYYLHTGSLGLKEHWNPRSSGDWPCDAEGPACRELLFRGLPDRTWLALGYEYYEAEDRLALAGGPAEMLVCPQTGKVVYNGPALDPGAAVLEILSPPDKQIAAMIPRTEKRRAAALAFAQNNHFFLTSERVRLTCRVRHRRPDWRAADLSLQVTLEDAYQAPKQRARPVKLTAAGDDLSAQLAARLGAATFISAPVIFTGLRIGVYHLRAELRRGEERILATRSAFEVMSADPAAPSPPQASGLPDLIPNIPDYATETGAFDPWVGRGVDAAHYLANCCHQILPARRDRIWNVVHLYRRKWVVELHRRMTPEKDPEKNADVLPHADRIYWNQRHDLWHGGYDQVVLDALLKFLRRHPPAGPAPADRRSRNQAAASLDAAAIASSRKLSFEMYCELLTRHWKEWVEFFNQYMLQEHLPAMHRRLRAVNAGAEWVTYGIYPPYGSAYKGAYFARYTGRDLRRRLERFYDGPMLLEDYPYMCGYPLQRAVFMLAALKMEGPGLKIYPEVYGINGCASDLRPVYGRPPYGHSHTPPPFFRKTFFEYAFAAAWFDAAGWHFWRDNGFQAMAWNQAHYREMLRAWGTIRKHPPARPLRTTAFAVSRGACLAHPDTFTPTRTNPDFELRLDYHDVVNTAEEAPAFAYEQARLDGQQAGFLADLAAIEQLDPADAHSLVLPPLTGVSMAIQQAIRRLHARGVALVGFEEAGSLADLFGIRRLERPLPLRALQAAAGRAGIWRDLPAAAEECATPHCRAAYDAASAATLIAGLDARGRKLAAALVCRQTRWGRTVFFTIPPTMVQRLDLKNLVSYGKESRSVLMNRAMALALRWAGRPAVESTAGKLIAFYDRRGQANIVVMEDNHPAPAQTIRPVLTIRLPRLAPARIRCDCPWHLVEKNAAYLRLSLELAPHASAHFVIVPDVASRRRRK